MTVSNFHNLDRLELVVPTYERRDYALRLMEYWNNRYVHLIVLDGSTVPIAPHLLQSFGRNIEYYHLPVSYQERLKFGASIVQREFQAQMSDDEFYLPSALNSVIDYLDSHPKYWAATGKVVRFYWKSDKVYGQEWYNKGYSDYPESAKSLSQLARTKQFQMPHYMMLGVTRTTHWKNIWSQLYSNDYSCPYVYEATYQMIAPYVGLTDTINELLWMRSSETEENISGTWNRRLPLHVWFDDVQNASEVVAWKESIVKLLKVFASGEISQIDVEGIADFLIERQISGSRPKNYTWNRKQRIHRALRRLTPQGIRTLLKGYLPRKVLGRLGFSVVALSRVGVEMELSGIRVNAGELAEIIEIVNRFHSNNSN